MLMAANYIHCSHLFFTENKQFLLSSKHTPFLTTFFFIPLHFFSSSPPCILKAYDFALSPTNSEIFFHHIRPSSLPQPFYSPRQGFPKDDFVGNLTCRIYLGHQLKYLSRNHLLLSHTSNYLCLSSTDLLLNHIFSLYSYNENHTSETLTNRVLTCLDKLVYRKPFFI